ncbi:MAG: DUF1826 domain-containing protein [Hyphomicrobiales bacterium]
MTLMPDVQKGAAVGVEVAHKLEDLTIVAKLDCAASIWHRKLTPAFQAWIDDLDRSILPSARIILKPQAVQHALFNLCNENGLPDGPERRFLIKDISNLADVFCRVMDAPFVRVRLERVTTNACRKFHVDSVVARLICTYRGTGTQYSISGEGSEPKRIFTAPTGSAMLLRGKLWPEQPHLGLLHRSPPIEGSGETRLVLVLDPVFDLEEEV